MTPTVDAALSAAQTLQDARLAAIRDLAAAHQEVQDAKADKAARMAQVLRETTDRINAAEKTARRAWTAAQRKGWTTAELKAIGFTTPPGGRPRGARRPAPEEAAQPSPAAPQADAAPSPDGW